MKISFLPFIALAAISGAPAPKPALAPSEIVAAAPAADWIAIAPADVLVMTLGNGKRVVIQLMPAPFSQGWIGNIRKLAAARWWDGLSINRVQDNYVVQWGDASEKKALPVGLELVSEECYVIAYGYLPCPFNDDGNAGSAKEVSRKDGSLTRSPPVLTRVERPKTWQSYGDSYGATSDFHRGWPVVFGFGRSARPENWPVHCYGMVGVGRNLSPDTGSGAELYTVIGHAPRHLDRNIALVGRVIEGIEHLSSLPRGTEALGFYKTAQERTTISSIRIGTDIADVPRFEYLSTDSSSFAAYADARANRRDPFFIRPAGGADICNIPVPVRRIR